MGARFEPCHDTAQSAQLAYFAASRTALPAQYGSPARAICCDTDARSARLCTPANTPRASAYRGAIRKRNAREYTRRAAFGQFNLVRVNLYNIS